jgi:hypothetical protein
MSFQRRNKRIISTSTPIDTFGETLSKIADATVNLDENLINAATLLNIPSRTLSMMILSNNPNQIECVTLIRNLSESLKEYPDGVLPDQLSQYIIQLNQHIQDHPILEDDIPSFFELICPNVRLPLIIYEPNHDHDYNDDYNSNNDDYNSDNDNQELNDSVLISVSEENIKDDICVICFLNLNQEPDVIQTICNHQYHKNCITQWINIKKCCPLCKFNL